MKSESRWANFRNSISCSWVSPLVLQWTEETAMNKKNEANKLKELPCKQHKIITWSAVLYNSSYNFWSSRYHGNSTKVSSLHYSWMLTGASWNTAHFCIYTTWLRPIIPAHGFYTNDTQPCFSFQPHDTCSSVDDKTPSKSTIHLGVWCRWMLNNTLIPGDFTFTSLSPHYIQDTAA